jgi:hypothetical protein
MQKGAPQQGDAPTHADRMRALSAASVQRNSRSFQMGDIRALTTICHAASSPIRHTLTKEKLAHNIQNPIHQQKTPLIKQTPRHRTARGHEKRARP